MDSTERRIFLKHLVITFIAVITIDVVVENVASLFREGHITGYSSTWSQVISFVLVSIFVAYLNVRRYRKKMMGC